MTRSFVVLGLLLGLSPGFATILYAQEAPEPKAAPGLISYEQWKTRVMFAPSNRSLAGRMPAREQLPLPDYGVVKTQAVNTLKQFQTSELADSKNWIGAKPKQNEFFDTDRSYYTRSPVPFQPFAQKYKIPVGSQVVFHGDFHGDIRSMIGMLDWLNEKQILDGFRIKDPKTWMVFLGDYVDRGSYGVEVLYTLMRLKLANPKQVLMVRGNHEDFKMTASYGFLNEVQSKYGPNVVPFSIWRMYDFLPVVIYLGAGENYIQCNHGGMEPGFSPRKLLAAKTTSAFQLLGALNQKTFAGENPGWLRGANSETRRMAAANLDDFIPQSPTSPDTIGFMWNDYMVFRDEQPLGYDSNRLAFVHGQGSTQYLLKHASSKDATLQAVFRAHQHSSVANPMMNRLLASNGVFRHWQSKDSASQADTDMTLLEKVVETNGVRSIPKGSVWTFNVAPDSVYGIRLGYSFDAFGILKTADKFADWKLQVVNVKVQN